MDSGKCSRRRLRRTIRALAGAVALAAPGAPAIGATDGPAVEALQRFLETVDTLTAEFHEQVYDADRELVEEASGSFVLERPDRFVWNYRTPYEQVMLADRDTLWMYDVELEQVTVAPLEESAGSPAMLLSGRSSVLDSFEIESTYSSDGYDWVDLVPVQPNSEFSVVALAFDADGLPRRLRFVNSLNQTAHIEFSEIVVNAVLDDDAFELDLPDDVDVMGTEGRR